MIWILWVHGIVHRQVAGMMMMMMHRAVVTLVHRNHLCKNPGALVTQKVLKRREPDRAYAHMDPSHAHTHPRLLLLLASHHRIQTGR